MGHGNPNRQGTGSIRNQVFYALNERGSLWTLNSLCPFDNGVVGKKGSVKKRRKMSEDLKIMEMSEGEYNSYSSSALQTASKMI